MSAAAGVRLSSTRGRWILAATVLGTGMAFLDGTVITIALPTIGEDLDASLDALQWTVNAYALTLAGLLLLGGALGDRFGRRRVFLVGVIWFAAASALCALAPNVETLIAARALQGVGGALLTPGSLALIEASFAREDRGAAVGSWSGLGGIAAAAGPFVGGWLIGAASWRLIFLINLPIAAAVVWAGLRHVPESRDETLAGTRLDLAGATLAALTLAGATYALTTGPVEGWGAAAVVAGACLGLAAATALVVVERRSARPLVPPALLRVRRFASANAVTFAVYAALGAALFLLPLQLQGAVGLTPLEAGAALTPMTLVMLLLSSRAGRLATRIGPRPLLTIGPIVVGLGMSLLSSLGAGDAYVTAVLPGVVVLALGLAITVAPLTSTVLDAAPETQAGIASAVNNTVARSASLLAIAVVPLVAGIPAGTFDPAAIDAGFARGMGAAAALCAVGGLVAFLTVGGPAPVTRRLEDSYCPLDGPPLRAEREDPAPSVDVAAARR